MEPRTMTRLELRKEQKHRHKDPDVETGDWSLYPEQRISDVDIWRRCREKFAVCRKQIHPHQRARGHE